SAFSCYSSSVFLPSGYPPVILFGLRKPFNNSKPRRFFKYFLFLHARSRYKAKKRAESRQSRKVMQPDLQPMLTKEKILKALSSGLLTKAEIAKSLGMEGVAGYLNRVVR
ncbi:MAG: hypothetical protein JW932_03805, partial [Deltaproteobacteria bacterium]|nr:hypothetical protein [Deltaproteobacteria bacterium]